MRQIALKDELVQALDRLPRTKQKKVLSYARSLAGRTGQDKSVHEMLRFYGVIPKADAFEISAAIAEECERINYEEW